MTNNSISPGRIDYIDIAKCFAIISVVVCHVLLMDSSNISLFCNRAYGNKQFSTFFS